MKGFQAISLVGFPNAASVKAFIDAWPYARFELAYNMSESFLKEVTPILAGRVVSVHSCCPLESFFPNFASYDAEIIEKSHTMLRRSVSTSLEFGVPNVVLHPGYATDCLIPSEVHERMALLEAGIFKDYVGRAEGSIARSDYTVMSAYRKRFESMQKELAQLGRSFSGKGLHLAVENLNPRAGYMCMTAEEMIEIASIPDVYLCLDVGHLWISHLVFGFSFPAAIERIMATGKVVSCHLHSNASGQNGVLEDSHDDFDANGFPCKMIIDCIKESGANMVLETLNHPVYNAQVLFHLLEESA